MQRSAPSSASVWLEIPSAGRRTEFLAAVRRSRDLHRPWVQPPATRTAYDRWLGHNGEPSCRRFLICRCGGGELVGVASLSAIVRGALESAFLGYYLFAPWTGQGFMTAGLALVLQQAFRTLRLHRVEANIQPGNSASREVLRRLHFRLEGFSPRYLKIAGHWRDHERWALLAGDWRKPHPKTSSPPQHAQVPTASAARSCRNSSSASAGASSSSAPRRAVVHGSAVASGTPPPRWPPR